MTSTFRQEFEARYADKAAAARKKAKPHARKAGDELLKLGAPVYFHLAGEHGTHFIIGAELRDNDDSLFCDYYQEDVRERWDREDVPVAERKILNAQGIKTEVHDVLKKHGLYAEWINPGQVGVYDA
ncbi:hypothetical protein CcrColossus_gp320 [Caulobacter phage CcrColossus]|uniref:Uncharacterized protein n=1 Tax=Caulobacter phage CcrColossus TaxID=1211640 RepID=K4JV02_9CAUD|nr:hypothetical protein CcrColossus_gp320 [Caulobacter phage CcrColossus]AFU88190.1 hypothetical protein CcrColossus_gp320 [Caulobacter phage CcrColossus]